MSIPVFFHPAQLEFHPKYEWALGNRIKHPETTKRAESIYRALKKMGRDYFDLRTPEDKYTHAIHSCHSPRLSTLYHTASQVLEGENTFYPSVFPQRMRGDPDPTNIKHAGFFCFDSGTPLNNKTLMAANWSASSALAATDLVASGKSTLAYALSRPPGHHASVDSYGGYCYFNNAACAAKRLLKKGARVAIIDIDFHHGNGTQDFFYQSSKVFTASLHGDPTHHFPYFCGYPRETGKGAGLGMNMNIILPDGTILKNYLKALKGQAIPAIKRFCPDYLIIAAGLDTYKLDPIGSFALETADYHKIGETLGRLPYPTIVLQEGGYHTGDLGANVVSLLTGMGMAKKVIKARA